MGIADWTINKSAVDVVAGIDPVNTLVGNGSLRLIDFGNNTLNMVNNLYTRGLTRGRIRMLIRLESDTQDSLGDDFYNVGMFIMSDSDDVTVPDSFGQQFYTYSLAYDAFTTSHVISLDFHDNAIEDVPLTLFQTAPFTLTRGVDVVPLELEWKLEPEYGPGIHFTLRGATAPSTLTDFSNLVVLDEFIHNDPSTLLQASVSEGLYLEGLGGSLPSGLEALVDQVSIFSLTRL